MKALLALAVAASLLLVPGTADARRSATATTHTLTVIVSGTGSGHVFDDWGKIPDCTSTCTADYDAGTDVLLIAGPEFGSGSVFSGWSGEGCSGTGTCDVTMDQDRTVTATFAPATTYTVTTTKIGAGSGKVASDPPGIDCGTACTADFGADSTVTLTATPDSGSVFGGWSGDCSGTDSCTLTMDGPKSVQATFRLASGDVSIAAVHGQFFANPTNDGAFTATPSDTPVFAQDFPVLNFNPPSAGSGTALPCNNDPGVNVETRPFTDVVPLVDGSCTTEVAQGSGHSAGLGDLNAFDAVFTTTLTVSAPGTATFSFFSDDGWIMGAGTGPDGAQPTYVSGALQNAPDKSPFQGYAVVGAYNTPSSPTENTLEVDFPAAGSYPIELDYSECCGGELSFTVQANGASIPPVTATVDGITASCAGNTLTATATAHGSPGSSFTLTLEKSSDGTTFTDTGQSATIALTDAASYSHDFDLTSMSATAYRVVSGDVRSDPVPGDGCGPGTTVPEAPAALLLPLSLLGSLAFAAAAFQLTRRRRKNAS